MDLNRLMKLLCDFTYFIVKLNRFIVLSVLRWCISYVPFNGT